MMAVALKDDAGSRLRPLFRCYAMNSGEIDPQYSDLHHEISTTGGPNQSYSVKSGDNLSKISNRFHGSPNHYSNIAAASNISDPNKIQVGQQVTAPPLN
jgi:hypothetical protein